MKKFKNVCRKAIATVEVAALTMTLMGGMAFIDSKEVKAAENELILNEGVTIVSEGEETLSFTAPEEGTYYFYSKGDDCDPYAELTTDNDTYESDDVSGYDFMISASLAEGEVCELLVGAYEIYEDLEYTTEIYVVDEATAATIVFGIESEELYVTVGEAYTIEAEMYSLTGDIIEELPEGYSVKWFKETDESTVELVGNELSYNIQTVLNSYLCTEANDNVEYKIVLYYDGEEYADAYFSLYNIEWPEIFSGTIEYVNIGEEITLIPDANDVNGEIIDLSEKDNYTYEWYRYIDSEITYLEEESYEYTFEVTEDDIQGNAGRYIYIGCLLYIDGELAGDAGFSLHSIEDYFYCDGTDIYASKGDTITLQPIVYDYYDNVIELNEEDFEIDWYKGDFDYAMEAAEYVGSGLSYTIDEVTLSDMYSNAQDVNNFYFCEVYYKDGDSEATFIINDADYEYYSQEDYRYEEIGSTVTLEATLNDFNREEVDLSSEEFSFKWYAVVESEQDTSEAIEGEVIGTDSSYIIESVTSDDFEVVYVCEIYKNDIRVANKVIYISNVDDYVVAEGGNLSVNLGDTVVLEPYFVDYNGEIIELDESEYMFDWYKSTIDDYVYLGSESTYTIESVDETDFYDAELDEGYYICDIYNLSTDFFSTAYFYLEEADGVEMVFEPAKADNEFNPYGDWTVYVGTWGGQTADVAVDPTDASHIQIKPTASLWYDAWSLQAQYKVTGLVPGSEFTISADVTTDSTDGKFKTDVDETITELTGSTINVVKTATADENGEAVLTFGFGWVGLEVVIDIDNVTFDGEYEVEVPTEPETPTEAEPTTKAPETTTVAPTTKAPEVKAPAKAKIKKTYAKKKASKVAKIKIKKVKNAKGYQVQISKSKKFKGKNILVKKHTKKLKPSFKSKKLKNKKKLYARVRAYVLDSKGEKVYGKWSKAKKIKIK